MSSSTPTLKVERRKPRFRFVVFTSSCSDSLSSTRRRLIRGIRLIDEDRTFIDPDMLDKLCDDYEEYVSENSLDWSQRLTLHSIVLRIEALERDIKDSFAKSGPKKPNCFHVWRLNLSHLSQTRTLEIKAAQWERIVIVGQIHTYACFCTEAIRPKQNTSATAAVKRIRDTSRDMRTSPSMKP